MAANDQEFIQRLENIVSELDDQIVHFKQFFTPKEIEQFLFDVVNIMTDCRYSNKGRQIIQQIAHNDVKDVPDLGEDGRPLSNRFTPLHKVITSGAQFRDGLIEDLFMIYDRFDVNYTDESGLTHLHIACIAGIYDAVEQFLEHGADHNCIWSLSGDSPLHLALKYQRQEIAMLLLLQDFDPNLANRNGLTPLHLICRECDPMGHDMAEVFFLINEAKQRTVNIDARDNEGNTPLHLALACGNRKEPEVLLRRGADPTLINAEESTCLHIICHFKYDDNGLAQLFFKIIDDMGLVVEVEAQDRSRQTPMQLALENFLPAAAKALLEHGAVFPGYDFLTSHLTEKFNSNEASSCNYKLRLACGVVGLIESLENQGYRLDDANALTIMRLFDEHGLIKRSATFNESWHDDDFVTSARYWNVNADLKLDVMNQNRWLSDLVRMRPDEAAKLIEYRDWAQFARPSMRWDNLPEQYHKPLVMHMCEIMARRFFRKHSVYPFWDLVHKRLPIECCTMIVDNDDLTNEDLFIICLVAGTPNNDALQGNEPNDAPERNELNDTSESNESNDSSGSNESSDSSESNGSNDSPGSNESNDSSESDESNDA